MLFKKHEINMLEGPLFKNIIVYTIPMILSGILQLLYNAADVVVVGRWAGSESLAAVGSCGALMNLVTNLFLGLSVGTSVIVAQSIGAQKLDRVDRAVHTTVALSVVGGIAIGLFGVLFARTAMELMDTPEDVIELSTLYIRICFAGVPGIMVYNFGAAVLRAVGDTKRPLYFLAASGLVNVALNLVFVIAFHMGVAGVGLATIISQYLSAVMIIVCLMRSDQCYHLDIFRLHIYKEEAIQMVRVGLPAGLQGTLFSFSNVLIQSTVNSFGSVVMAGNSAAANLEGFIYTSMNSLYQTALTFTGQNYGARQYKRTRQVLWTCQYTVTAVGLIVGGLVYLFRYQLLAIYSPDADVIAAGAVRNGIICLTYFLCGNMDVMVGGMRGIGYSFIPMVVSLLGACGLRIVWIYFVLPLNPTLKMLYISYPISWIVTTLVHIVCYLIVSRKLPQDGELPPPKRRRGSREPIEAAE